MLDMQDTMRRGMVLAMVQRQITCRFTGRILDVDRCAVVFDPDGDPMDVAHASVMELLGEPGIAAIEAEGCRIEVAPYAEAVDA